MKYAFHFVLAILIFTFSEFTPIRSQSVTNSSGAIAYVRANAEIRIVNPDGSNDHRIWSLPRPDLAATMGINGVAWRPDGKEIAFSSAHEAVQSLYLSDLYAIKPDGSGFRRITNPPDPGDYARAQKGSVSVTVQNAPAGILAAPATSFLVY